MNFPDEGPVASSLQSAIPLIIDYDNEFGPELICAVPSIYWLKENGLLRGRKVKLFEGMRSFYYFLEPEDIIWKSGKRSLNFLPQRNLWLANSHEHYATPKINEIYPDYRSKYQNDIFSYEKPILVINNKVAKEWTWAPVNLIPLSVLEVLFRSLRDKFQIIYTRQGILPSPSGYSDDKNEMLPFDDLALLEKFPDIEILELLAEKHSAGLDYNTVKNMIFANCYRFISSQGGGAHHISLFSGSVIAVIHRMGEESRFAYTNGFYKYYANPAPTTLVCPSPYDLLSLVTCFRESATERGQAYAGDLDNARRFLAEPRPDADRLRDDVIRSYQFIAGGG